MTFSIELLPAPLGPMIARTSCSRTSKLISVNAFTPPNASEMPSSCRMTSPMPRALIGPPRLRPHWPIRPLRCPPRGRYSRLGTARRRSSGPPVRRRERLRVFDPQVRRHHVRAAVLEAQERLDMLDLFPAIERVDQHPVFLGDEVAPDLAGAARL